MINSNNYGPERQVMLALAVVPNAAADLCTKDAILYSVHVCNVTGTAATITIQDKAGSPLSILNAYSVPANSFVNIPFNEGVPMTGGVRWVAGTSAALHAYLDIRRKD